MTTPSQTVGPYLSLGLRWADGAGAAVPGAEGWWLRGQVVDGAGSPVTDALVETWQADASGRFDHPDDPRGAAPGEHRGFGRSETRTGEYAIRTVKPGRVPDAAGLLQAPHIAVSVFARGLMDRVVTRMYFADEAGANAEDPLLGALTYEQRDTLLASPSADGYRFDVVLQGDRETVFFDL